MPRDHSGPLISLPSVGRSATHALVQAQLICSGARQGIHAFIVPIRSLQDHTPLPGKPLLLPPAPARRKPCQASLSQGPRGPWEKLGHVTLGSSWTDLVLTDWVTLSKIQHLSDLSLVICKTGVMTSVSQASVRLR